MDCVAAACKLIVYPFRCGRCAGGFACSLAHRGFCDPGKLGCVFLHAPYRGELKDPKCVQRDEYSPAVSKFAIKTGSGSMLR